MKSLMRVLVITAASFAPAGLDALEQDDWPFADVCEECSPEETQSYSIRCQDNRLQIESRIVKDGNSRRTKSLRVLLDGKELTHERLDMVRHAFFSDPILLDVGMSCSDPNGFGVGIRYRWRVSNPRVDSPPVHSCGRVFLFVTPRDGNRVEVSRAKAYPAVQVDTHLGRGWLCF
jgi:hypothetical protein